MAVRWSVKVLREWVERCAELEGWESCSRAVEEAYGRWQYKVPYAFFSEGVFRDVLLRMPSNKAWSAYELLCQSRGEIPFDEELYTLFEMIFTKVLESPTTPENKIHARGILEVIRLAKLLSSPILRE